MDYVEQIMESLGQYKVKDLVSPSARVVFILESPHLTEMETKIPASGVTGLVMSKIVFSGNHKGLPMGKILDLAIRRNSPLASMGIMNVCQIPLQPSAYKPEIQDHYSRLFKSFNKIRNTGVNDLFTLTVHTYILKDFQRRVNSLNKPVVAIACGKVSQSFIEILKDNPNFIDVYYVPHPASNLWYNEEVANEVREILANCLGG